MIRMHALTPRGMPHQSGRTPLTPGTICQHCFAVLGNATTTAQRSILEARHRCPEKLLAQKPAAPMPFS